jgi:dTDP-4-dehydrorhamnose 3,5-epimerase
LKFHKASIDGAWLIELEPRADERGSFARTFCEEEFATHGLETRIVQANLSRSRRAGTLRGVHFQLEPCAEVKVVRVQRGAIWDVIVDLRKDSPTFATWYGANLTADNGLALYVPRGFGHAFMTLVDDTDVCYHVSACYTPQLERGVRWNDPDIRISWPLEPTVMSDKDRALPLLSEVHY